MHPVIVNTFSSILELLDMLYIYQFLNHNLFIQGEFDWLVAMNDQYNKQSCRILLSNNTVQILCSVLLLTLPKLKVAVIVKNH